MFVSILLFFSENIFRNENRNYFYLSTDRVVDGEYVIGLLPGSPVSLGLKVVRALRVTQAFLVDTAHVVPRMGDGP